MNFKISALLVCTVLLADMVFPTCANMTTELPATPIVVETVTETLPVTTLPSAPETTAYEPAVPIRDVGDGFTLYSIYGIIPKIEWQRYLWDKLNERGCAWFYPYAVCQIFQESRWNAESTNGRDHGLCQQKGIYWESRASHFGIPGADIWDPYAQMHVYACMMCGYLAECGGDVGKALSAYYLGTWDYSKTYVSAVLAHETALEVVR